MKRPLASSTVMSSYSVAFLATAERVEAIARHSKDGGHRVSAREAFLRACTYWRTGSNFLSHADPRHRSAMQRQIDCFVEAGRLFDHPFEDLSIPIDNEQTVPAYFLKPDHTDTQRPTLICIGGGDTTAEEVYFWGMARPQCAEAITRCCWNSRASAAPTSVTIAPFYVPMWKCPHVTSLTI